MSDRLVERCVIEFERYVANLHSSVARHGSVSVPWAPYEQDEVTATDIPYLLREVRRAYEARAWFATEAPAWAQPLPLGEECNGLIRAQGAMHMLGCYAFSLQLLSYDYQLHPPFHAFGCGMMAQPHCPAHVRDDPELQAEFPAKACRGWVAE